MVIKARTPADIAHIFQTATRYGRKVVFRAGGTSLSGQSIGDDLLVEVKQGWRELQVLEHGQQIRLQPGVVTAKANQHLEPLGYRLGPDPGSIRSALIGGVVANNASGIGSGNYLNSYQTLAAMELILPNGLILNTARPQDDERLHSEAPEIYTGLLKFRQQILRNPALSNKIRSKYKLKNTTGYALNSFLDYERPLEILAHLMVGSEGTLGFIASVTLDTVPLLEQRATCLLLLPDLNQAAKLVPRIKKLGSYALELMDDAALRAVQHIAGLPDTIYSLIPNGSAALLIEFQANNETDLAALVTQATQAIQKQLPTLQPDFLRDAMQRDRLWKVRRELGPLHAATRPPGTTVLSEDVCFKVKDLARAIKDLKILFRQHNYADAVIFGHAGDGNLHFKLSVNFGDPRQITAYAEFMEALTDLVVHKYDGSLKAEHGTGRNMAPFVEREWGPEAYGIMCELKQLLDPAGILNPGVVITHDPQIHLKHIKAIPLVDPLVDQCIECGLCEPWCPSADLTLTPRQRISVLREIEIMREEGGDPRDQQRLLKDFQYFGVATCATDGLCGLSCPVAIDTGMLMKQQRGELRGAHSTELAQWLQHHFATTMTGFRLLIRMATPLLLLLKSRHVTQVAQGLARVTRGRIPAPNFLLKAARYPLPQTPEQVADVIYYPSCLSRGFADPLNPGLSVPQAFKEILDQAGIRMGYPQQLDALCCGLTFSSKGFPDAALQAAIQTTEMLWISSQTGKLPIVMDTSPCTNHMRHYDQILSGVHLARWRDLQILDVVEYLHATVLDKLSLWQVEKQVVLHPTCSTRRMGIEQQMRSIASRCAQEVIIPMDTGCCGFAGDRGMLVPELTIAATAAEAREVRLLPAEGHYSTSRTCEIGMSLATDKSYQSLIYLVHKALIRQSV